MNKHSNIALDQHSADFIEQQVEEGNFRSPGDVVRAGLQLLEERQQKIEHLRAAIVEGEESGEPQPFDFDEFLKRMYARHKK